MTTILVASVLADKYLNGGHAWVVMSWVLGFKHLGFKTYLLEQIDRERCVDSEGNVTSFKESVNLTYFKRVTRQFGLAGSAVLIYADGRESYGLDSAELAKLGASADLLVNITGHLTFV